MGNMRARVLTWLMTLVCVGGCVDEFSCPPGTGVPVAAFENGNRTCERIGADAGVCGACPASTPVCDETATPPGCVECTAQDSTFCVGATPVCDTDANMCIGCADNSNCTTAEAPRCDTVSGMCEGCDVDGDCAGVAGFGACNAASGSCVECTPANEAACDSDSCDPASNTCTATQRGSVSVCGACIADSECGDELGGESSEYRCAALEFGGVAQGGRCLKLANPTCAVPFGATINRASLSGAEAADYCGINEVLTTCEAVLAGAGGQGCPGGDATLCAPEGAQCEQIGLVADRCTYSCDNSTQCAVGSPTCGAGGFCQ